MEIIKLSGYKNIYATERFSSEYAALFGKSRDAYSQHLKKLRINLAILDKELRQAIIYQQFEQLEGTELYAIRHVSKINPRVVFVYTEAHDRIVLLSAFKEKSRADYDRALEQARQRLRQLEVEK